MFYIKNNIVKHKHEASIINNYSNLLYKNVSFSCIKILWKIAFIDMETQYFRLHILHNGLSLQENIAIFSNGVE